MNTIIINPALETQNNNNNEPNQVVPNYVQTPGELEWFKGVLKFWVDTMVEQHSNSKTSDI